MMRWISRDPIGYEGGVNLYEYVGGMSIQLHDSNGTDWVNNISDGFAGFGDTITFGGTSYIRRRFLEDPVDYNSPAYCVGEIAGIGHGIASGLAGGSRALAGVGGTKWGRILNRNRYIRFGPGRMPKNGRFPAGPKVPRVSIGKGPGNPHIDLRFWPFD